MNVVTHLWLYLNIARRSRENAFRRAIIIKMRIMVFLVVDDDGIDVCRFIKISSSSLRERFLEIERSMNFDKFILKIYEHAVNLVT